MTTPHPDHYYRDLHELTREMARLANIKEGVNPTVYAERMKDIEARISALGYPVCPVCNTTITNLYKVTCPTCGTLRVRRTGKRFKKAQQAKATRQWLQEEA